MLKHILYVNKSHDDLESIKVLLKKVKEKHQVDFHVVTADQLNEESREELLNQIRSVSLREKIRVKSGGGGILLISRSGKLNMEHIPILAVIENEKMAMVYPHEKGPKGHRFGVTAYLKRLLKAETVKGFEQQAISEDDICRITANFPSIIEDGLKYISREVEVEGGVIDMVFVDRQENHLLIEIEIKATDAAIGQVSRFPIPYAEKYGIPHEKIRKAIVCIEISESRIVACRENDIEVYQFGIKRRV